MMVKNKLIMAAGITVFVLALGGCKSKETQGPSPVKVEAINQDDGTGQADGADQDDGTDQAEDADQAGGADQGKDADQAEGTDQAKDADQEESAKTPDTQQPENPDMPGGAEGSENAERKKVVNLSAYEDHFGGKVESIEDGDMVIRKTLMEGNLVVQPDDESKAVFIKVKCTEETKYQHWTIKSGGGDIDIKEGSLTDIQVGTGLEIGGYYEGDVFIAQQVLIEVYE